MLFSVDDSVLLGYDAASLCNQTLTSRVDEVFDLQRSRNFQDRALRTWVRFLFVARMCMSIFVCFCCSVLVEILRQADPTSKENFQMPTNKIQKPGECEAVSRVWLMCQHIDRALQSCVFNPLLLQKVPVPAIICFCFFLFILFSKTVRWPLALTQPRMNNWHFFPQGKADI